MILLAIALILLALFPRWMKGVRREQKRRQWASQLRESLQIIVNALRSGTGLMQALSYAAQEGSEPLATDWKKVLQGVSCGQSWSKALEELAGRVTLPEMRWFAVSVQITQATGASLKEVLETLSNTLQEQQALREKVNALTAQGRASGMILSALPFLILAGVYVIVPEMVRPLFTTWMGQCLLSTVLVLLSAGGWLIHHIVSIKVDA